MSLLASGTRAMVSVYLPSVSRSTTLTCRLINTIAATYVSAEDESRGIAAKYVIAPAPSMLLMKQ